MTNQGRGRENSNSNFGQTLDQLIVKLSLDKSNPTSDISSMWPRDHFSFVIGKLEGVRKALFLGNKTKNSNATSYGYAHTDLVDNGTDIQTVDWRLISEDTKNDIWNYAGKKLKIRCEFQQRRSKYPPFQNSATYIL